MQRRPHRKGWIAGIIFILLVSFACRIPTGENNQNPAEDLEATIAVLETQVAEATQVVVEVTPEAHAPEVEPTTAVEAPADEPPADEPSGEPAGLYQGFVAYENGRFIGYDFSGNPNGFNSPAGEPTWYGENEVGMSETALYYSQFGDDSGVFRVNAQGTQKLDFIDVNEPVSISVNQEGSRIAWGTNEWMETAPRSELFIANSDGSGQQLIAELEPGEQVDYWRIYHPYRWMEDGRLVYATGMTGIGGYLLFWGYNGMYVYDPANGSTTTLVSDNERLGLCLSSVSSDLSKAAIVCDDGSDAVRVRNLNNGQQVVFPELPDQGTAGSARFSPSGSWLAYVIQRLDFENERGQVVVVPTDGSAAPQSIASFEGGAYTVEGWYDEDHFLVTRSDFESDQSIWVMSRDGSEVTQIVSGQFVSFMP